VAPGDKVAAGAWDDIEALARDAAQLNASRDAAALQT
jgi:hypothetical protein